MSYYYPTYLRAERQRLELAEAQCLKQPEISRQRETLLETCVLEELSN
ncbi:MAG: hypothetical protein V3W33_05745 [Gammaproteobacteria bacterium]|jgi:hypothetical protein